MCRLGVPDEDIETVVLIVKNHLEMARFWQSHDIEDESEIAKFASIAGDEETLKLLYITTFWNTSGEFCTKNTIPSVGAKTSALILPSIGLMISASTCPRFTS